LHYFLYFLHFSSHSTRYVPKIALFPCIFFIFHRIQQETFKKLYYFLRALACTGVLWRALACSGMHWRALACSGVLWRALACSAMQNSSA
jgi:hypothetical protein